MPNLLQSFYNKFSGGSGTSSNNDPHFNFSRNYLCAMSFSFPNDIPFPTEYSLQDITLLSQAVNTPDIELSGVERESTVEVKNLGGSWTGVGEVNIQPTDNTFAISLIDTVRPVHEMFFLPWLKYVVEANRRPPASSVGNYGRDQSYPFSRAQLRIFFFNNISTPSLNDSTTITRDSNIALEYLIDGVFPVEIENRKMNYGEQSKLVRDVKFAFNRIDCVTLPNVNPSREGLSYATVGKVTAPPGWGGSAVTRQAIATSQKPPVNIPSPGNVTVPHHITVSEQTNINVDLIGGLLNAGEAAVSGARAGGIARAALNSSISAQQVVVVTDTIGVGSPASSLDSFGNLIKFR